MTDKSKGDTTLIKTKAMETPIDVLKKLLFILARRSNTDNLRGRSGAVLSASRI